MKIFIFAKALAAFTVIAMIALFASPAQRTAEILVDIIKYEGLALAASIVVMFAYPHVKGLEAGELVFITSSDPVTNNKSFFIATALENGKKQGNVRVNLGNGNEAVAVIDAYAGIIMPARGRLTQESMVKII
jgi:hypothetical protein